MRYWQGPKRGWVRLGATPRLCQTLGAAGPALGPSAAKPTAEASVDQGRQFVMLSAGRSGTVVKTRDVMEGVWVGEGSREKGWFCCLHTGENAALWPRYWRAGAWNLETRLAWGQDTSPDPLL